MSGEQPGPAGIPGVLKGMGPKMAQGGPGAMKGGGASGIKSFGKGPGLSTETKSPLNGGPLGGSPKPSFRNTPVAKENGGFGKEAKMQTSLPKGGPFGGASKPSFGKTSPAGPTSSKASIGSTVDELGGASPGMKDSASQKGGGAFGGGAVMSKGIKASPESKVPGSGGLKTSFGSPTGGSAIR